MKAKLWYNNRKAEKNTRFQWTFHRLPGGLRNDSSQKTRFKQQSKPKPEGNGNTDLRDEALKDCENNYLNGFYLQKAAVMCLSDDRFAAFLSGLPDKEKEEPLYDPISEYAACGFTARISAASGTAPAAKPRLRPGKRGVCVSLPIVLALRRFCILSSTFPPVCFWDF